MKQRIREGELVSFKYVDDYPGIGECLLLEFNTYPPFRPIRPNRYGEYTNLLIEWAHQFVNPKEVPNG